MWNPNTHETVANLLQITADCKQQNKQLEKVIMWSAGETMHQWIHIFKLVQTKNPNIIIDIIIIPNQQHQYKNYFFL